MTGDEVGVGYGCPRSEILFEIKDGLGVITLNRPKALNALTHGMILEMEKVIPQWEKDPAVKAVILRGAGDRAFCAGGDVTGLYREMKDDPEGHAAPRLLLRRVHRQPPHLPLRQAVDLADRRHRHGRRRRPVGARLALGGEREVPVRHAGDHHRPLSRCRRRLFPDAPAGRAGHLPGAHQPSPEGGGCAVGRHRRCPCAEREDRRAAGRPRRGRSFGSRRQPQGRCRDRRASRRMPACRRCRP